MKKFILFFSFVLIYILLSCTHPEENPIIGQPDRIIIAKVKNDKLKEISGMAVSKINNNIFWVNNDSGDEARIFAINTKGEIVAEVYLNGATNIDWEDIIIVKNDNDDKPIIYIGDIGDNMEQRNNYKFYVFQEPTIDTNNLNQIIKIDNYKIIQFNYNDKPHDCESFFVYDNKIHLLTKSDSMSKYYIINQPDELKENIAEYQYDTKIGKYRTRYPMSSIVGADLSNDRQQLLVKSYDSIYYYKLEGSWYNTLKLQPQFVKYVPEIQGESVAWNSNDSGYYTISEVGPINIIPILYYYHFNGPINK